MQLACVFRLVCFICCLNYIFQVYKCGLYLPIQWMISQFWSNTKNNFYSNLAYLSLISVLPSHWHKLSCRKLGLTIGKMKYILTPFIFYYSKLREYMYLMSAGWAWPPKSPPFPHRTHIWVVMMVTHLLTIRSYHETPTRPRPSPMTVSVQLYDIGSLSTGPARWTWQQGLRTVCTWWSWTTLITMNSYSMLLIYFLEKKKV